MTAASPIELLVTEERFFRIDSIEGTQGSPDYLGYISLRSDSFALHRHRFYFSDLSTFLSQVRQIHHSLTGTAELREQYERNHLCISVTKWGHITVSGQFSHFDEREQSLQFQFKADQTYLPAFIRSLENVCRELKVDRGSK